MKKLIFGAVTALVVSGSALANDLAKESKKVEDVKQTVRTYCRVTVTRTSPSGVQTSTTTYYEVSSGEAGAKQCENIRKNIQASLSVAEN